MYIENTLLIKLMHLINKILLENEFKGISWALTYKRKLAVYTYHVHV